MCLKYGQKSTSLIAVISSLIAIGCTSLTELQDVSTESVTGLSVLSPPNGQFLAGVGPDIESIQRYTLVPNMPSPGSVSGQVDLRTLDGLNTDLQVETGSSNIRILSELYPNSVLVIGVSFAEAAVQAGLEAGAFDENIRELAQTLATWDRPVFLRWGYAFNDFSSPVSLELFQAAWSKMRSALREAKAEQVMMVWELAQNCGSDAEQAAYVDWLPERGQVDWIGFSYFGPECRSADEWWINFAQGRGKPVMITEAAPRGYNLAETTRLEDGLAGQETVSAEEIWDEWFVGLLSLVRDNSHTVKAITYLNVDWDRVADERRSWGDSQIGSNAEIGQRWIQELMRAPTLNASPDLFDILKSPGDPGVVPDNPGEEPDPGDGGEPDPGDGGEPDPGDGGEPDPLPNLIEFGITAEGDLFHFDDGSTYERFILCVREDLSTEQCVDGQLEPNYIDGRPYYVRDILRDIGSATRFSIYVKILFAEDGVGQCVSDEVQVDWTPGQEVFVDSSCIP